MFNEEAGKVELTIAEQTNWRSIKGGDMETAMEIATAYRKAEMATVGSVQGGRTESDMGSIMMAICARGVDMPLQEIKVSDIETKGSLDEEKFLVKRILGFKIRPHERSTILGQIIKKGEDFNKVPPIVVTMFPDGKYRTMDGNNRSLKANSLGVQTLRGYVVPYELAYNSSILEEAATNYDKLIRERGGSIIDIPNPS